VLDEGSSDEKMARLMFAGDERATKTLLVRYRKPLYGLLFRLCRNSPDAEDLFQETFLRALRSGGRFDTTRRFKPWIFAIAINLARDRARRLAHPATPQIRGNDNLPEPASAEPPGREENEWIRRADLLAALGELPASIHEVVLLRYFEGMEEAEIAGVVGIPRGTVKSRLHRGIRILRDRLRKT